MNGGATLPTLPGDGGRRVTAAYILGNGQETIVDRINAINVEESARYVAADAARRRHWAKHPTGFAVLKCMDGRVHFPTMTQTPLGIVKPFRAMGGRFELGWPAFAKRVLNWSNAVRDRGDRCGIFVTYHFSASDPHLGCAGWAYDQAAARAHADRLARSIGRAFGDQITAIVTGVETDHDEIILHGPGGDVMGSNLVGVDADGVRMATASAFPEMGEQMLEDLLPFLIGNAAHVAILQHEPRVVQARGHNERVIAVGHGFDYWIARANLALIINDADPNLDVPIVTAAQIIERNLAETTDGDDALLLASVPYDTHGIERNLAIERVAWLREFSLQCIRDRHPSLLTSGRLHVLTGVTFERTKRLEIVDTSELR